MEASFIAQNFVPLLFLGLFVFLLSGIPVAFGLAATGLLFGFIGMEAGLFSSNLFQALPLRVFGIMQNETLLAIPSSLSWASSWSDLAWPRTCSRPWARCLGRCAAVWQWR